MSKTEESKVFVNGGGRFILTGRPPHLPSFQLLPYEQVGQSDTSIAGASIWAESGATNQELVGARWEGRG